jgi:hypothetical protein
MSGFEWFMGGVLVIIALAILALAYLGRNTSNSDGGSG